MPAPIFLTTVLCGLIAVVLICLRRIPEGQAYTLRRLDGHLRTVGAGVHLVLPLLERVTHKIQLLGNVVDVGMPGDRHARVYFQVLDARRADAVIDGIGDLLHARVPVLAAQTTPDAAALKAELNRELNTRGVLVTRVQWG